MIPCYAARMQSIRGDVQGGKDSRGGLDWTSVCVRSDGVQNESAPPLHVKTHGACTRIARCLHLVLATCRYDDSVPAAAPSSVIRSR